MSHMEKMLFTGGAGFLGRNIVHILEQSYQVTTCGTSDREMIKTDLSKDIPHLNEIYDIVVHAAGKAHVIHTISEEENAFYAVNYEGTKNLCAALEKAGVPKSFIFISTVAVYGCEYGELISETHPLCGSTPYAKSKIMAEEYLIKWCERNGVILTILRSSLLAGINPPGNLGDMIRGIRKGCYVNIAGGKVKKSIMMAEDIATLIPLVEDKGGIFNVCDTEPLSFGELSQLIAGQLGKRRPVSLPYWSVKCLALIGDMTGGRFLIDSKRLKKLTQSLTFSNLKAVETLGWQPLKVSDNFRISEK